MKSKIESARDILFLDDIKIGRIASDLIYYYDKDYFAALRVIYFAFTNLSNGSGWKNIILNM